MKHVRSLMQYLIVFVVIVPVFLLPGCESLEAPNLNNPDMDLVLSDPADVLELTGGTFRLWYNAVHAYRGPGLAAAVASDQSTCSWGNVAMLDMSKEPRIQWNNNVDYGYGNVTYNFLINLNSVVSQSNDVLGQINKGMEILDASENNLNPMVKTMCYFTRGISTAYLALYFDKGFIASEQTDMGSLEFSSWQVMIDSSLLWLDMAITLCNSNEFNLPDGWINGTQLNQDELSQVINSFAARILANSARNKVQNEAVDWSQVLSYADNGLDFNFSPVTDDITWIDDYLGYITLPTWGRIDHRIINLLDPDYPARWPDDNVSWSTPDGNDPGPANSEDLRLETDMEFLSTNNFNPERGYYHFSHYRHKRYDEWLLQNNWRGPVPIFMKTENDLIIAEARLRAGDRPGAIAILNDPEGSRISRGGLPPLDEGATFEEVLKAIFYERDIELLNSTMGISFFDMRRRDMLQPGTPLHFPVPAKELEVLGEPGYTFGGTRGIPGEDYSIGGWF